MGKHNFRLAVNLVVQKDNKVLLMRRFNTGWNDGMYALMGGHVEDNESLFDAAVREAKEELGIETIERDIDRTELYIADEAFYCGTGAQVSPITKIDNRPIGNGKPSEISLKIQKLYFDIVKGKVEKYRKWCVKVND